MKAQGISWLRHVDRMSTKRMPEIILKGRIFSRRMGLSRTKWLDNMVMAVRSWRGTVEARADWRTVVTQAYARQGLMSTA